MASTIGERMAILGTIDPTDDTSATITSDWVDMQKYYQISAYISLGLMDVTTFDAKLQEATDSSGSGAKDISDKAITQVDQYGGDKQYIISVNANELDIQNSFTHVALVVEQTGGTQSFMSALLLGAIARFKPVADHDISSVEQIVS